MSSDKLWFTAYAWAKLMYMVHFSTDEVGGMGISSPGDINLVEDILIPRQRSDVAYVKFDMDDYRQHIEHLVTNGVANDACQRIWIHTHPADSALPSGKDYDTFSRSFGMCPWAVMLIISETHDIFAIRRIRAGGMEADINLQVGIAWGANCPAIDTRVWDAEISERVSRFTIPALMSAQGIAVQKYDSESFVRPEAPKAYKEGSTSNDRTFRFGNTVRGDEWVTSRDVWKKFRIRAPSYNSVESPSIMAGLTSNEIARLLNSDAVIIPRAMRSILETNGLTLTYEQGQPIQFTHAEVPGYWFTSTELPEIDSVLYSDKFLDTCSSRDSVECCLAEDPIVRSRGLGTGGQTQVFPWYTLQGARLLLSRAELHRIFYTFEGAPDFLPSNDVQDPAIQTGIMDAAARDDLVDNVSEEFEDTVRMVYVACVDVLRGAAQEGLTVQDIEMNLSIMINIEIDDSADTDTVDAVVEAFRSKGYDASTPIEVITKLTADILNSAPSGQSTTGADVV